MAGTAVLSLAILSQLPVTPAPKRREARVDAAGKAA
ncbi:MAG: hypothetical protein K0S57_4173, partial [Ramlibacter sp.]|nr:hypothetical protein [Ramlibacter sp.]